MRGLQESQFIRTRALLKVRESNRIRIKSIQLAIDEISELDQSTIQKYWTKLSQVY
jgi:hypothetical protein